MMAPRSRHTHSIGIPRRIAFTESSSRRPHNRDSALRRSTTFKAAPPSDYSILTRAMSPASPWYDFLGILLHSIATGMIWCINEIDGRSNVAATRKSWPDLARSHLRQRALRCSVT